MAVSFVQQTAASQNGVSASFPGSVTAGNLIIVSGNISAVSDNQGNTYHLAVAHSNYQGVAIYYAWNVAASGTFTVTPTRTGPGDWVAEEWTGFGVQNPLAGSGGAHATNVSPVTASPACAAPTGCAVVVLGCANVGFPTSITGTNPSTWTQRMNFDGFDATSASGVITAGTVAATITYSSPSNTDGAIAYFTPDVIGTATVSTSHPTIDATGTFTAVANTGSGAIAIDVPQMRGDILNAPIHLTQMGRYVATAETNPDVHFTQMGRAVATKTTNPTVRLTQMARQVLYPFTCDAPGPPSPLIDAPVARVNLAPLWRLYRCDVKRRNEDTA